MKRIFFTIMLLLGNSLASQDMAPEFSQQHPEFWIGSKALSIKELRGKVLLLDVWTSLCINCQRSAPWVKAVEDKFQKQSFLIVGIHTPEFDREKKRSLVESRIQKYGYSHPVLMDNDYAYWHALGNHYWPAFYIVDKKGRIRGHFIGEMHIGTDRAQEAEALITELIHE